MLFSAPNRATLYQVETAKHDSDHSSTLTPLHNVPLEDVFDKAEQLKLFVGVNT